MNTLRGEGEIWTLVSQAKQASSHASKYGKKYVNKNISEQDKYTWVGEKNYGYII